MRRRDTAYWWVVAATLSYALIIAVMVLFVIAMMAIVTDPHPGWVD
jgi:hypothetical protein